MTCPVSLEQFRGASIKAHKRKGGRSPSVNITPINIQNITLKKQSGGAAYGVRAVNGAKNSFKKFANTMRAVRARMQNAAARILGSKDNSENKAKTIIPANVSSRATDASNLVVRALAVKERELQNSLNERNDLRDSKTDPNIHNRDDGGYREVVKIDLGDTRIQVALKEFAASERLSATRLGKVLLGNLGGEAAAAAIGSGDPGSGVPSGPAVGTGDSAERLLAQATIDICRTNIEAFAISRAEAEANVAAAKLVIDVQGPLVVRAINETQDQIKNAEITIITNFANLDVIHATISKNDASLAGIIIRINAITPQLQEASNRQDPSPVNTTAAISAASDATTALNNYVLPVTAPVISATTGIKLSISAKVISTKDNVDSRLDDIRNVERPSLTGQRDSANTTIRNDSTNRANAEAANKSVVDSQTGLSASELSALNDRQQPYLTSSGRVQEYAGQRIDPGERPAEPNAPSSLTRDNLSAELLILNSQKDAFTPIEPDPTPTPPADSTDTPEITTARQVELDARNAMNSAKTRSDNANGTRDSLKNTYDLIILINIPSTDGIDRATNSLTAENTTYAAGLPTYVSRVAEIEVAIYIAIKISSKTLKDSTNPNTKYSSASGIKSSIPSSHLISPDASAKTFEKESLRDKLTIASQIKNMCSRVAAIFGSTANAVPFTPGNNLTSSLNILITAIPGNKATTDAAIAALSPIVSGFIQINPLPKPSNGERTNAQQKLNDATSSRTALTTDSSIRSIRDSSIAVIRIHISNTIAFRLSVEKAIINFSKARGLSIADKAMNNQGRTDSNASKVLAKESAAAIKQATNGKELFAPLSGAIAVKYRLDINLRTSGEKKSLISSLREQLIAAKEYIAMNIKDSFNSLVGLIKGVMSSRRAQQGIYDAKIKDLSDKRYPLIDNPKPDVAVRDSAGARLQTSKDSITELQGNNRNLEQNISDINGLIPSLNGVRRDLTTDISVLTKLAAAKEAFRAAKNGIISSVNTFFKNVLITKAKTKLPTPLDPNNPISTAEARKRVLEKDLADEKGKRDAYLEAAHRFEHLQDLSNYLNGILKGDPRINKVLNDMNAYRDLVKRIQDLDNKIRDVNKSIDDLGAPPHVRDPSKIQPGDKPTKPNKSTIIDNGNKADTINKELERLQNELRDLRQTRDMLIAERQELLDRMQSTNEFGNIIKALKAAKEGAKASKDAATKAKEDAANKSKNSKDVDIDLLAKLHLAKTQLELKENLRNELNDIINKLNRLREAIPFLHLDKDGKLKELIDKIEKLLEDKSKLEKDIERLKEEISKIEDKIREEKLKEDKLKEDKLKEEKLKEDKLKEEKLKEEKLKEEKLKEEKLKAEKDALRYSRDNLFRYLTIGGISLGAAIGLGVGAIAVAVGGPILFGPRPTATRPISTPTQPTDNGCSDGQAAGIAAGTADGAVAGLAEAQRQYSAWKIANGNTFVDMVQNQSDSISENSAPAPIPEPESEPEPVPEPVPPTAAVSITTIPSK